MQLVPGHQDLAAVTRLVAVGGASTCALHAFGLHGETPGSREGAGDLRGVLRTGRLRLGLAGRTTHHLARVPGCCPALGADFDVRKRLEKVQVVRFKPLRGLNGVWIGNS